MSHPRAGTAASLLTSFGTTSIPRRRMHVAQHALTSVPARGKDVGQHLLQLGGRQLSGESPGRILGVRLWRRIQPVDATH
jgi:hypothetical protein